MDTEQRKLYNDAWNKKHSFFDTFVFFYSGFSTITHWNTKFAIYMVFLYLFTSLTDIR